MLQTTSQETIRLTAHDTADITTRRIRELNDDFRTSGGAFPDQDGRKLMTAGVKALAPYDVAAIALKVMMFTEFNDGNDPHGEHDFGSFDHEGHKIFWKIDYYDKQMDRGSPDPSDPSVTHRVLTVLLASEY